ncbi:hypothetical protein KEM54_005563, partial [Ascosphaera aggregata]
MSLNLSSRLLGGANSLRAGATAATFSLANAITTTTFICSQCRTATLFRRPKRPYTFTQLIALSDGSTFLHRTTSPFPVYRSTRDTRNAPEWNPSSAALTNTENDEAGQLAAFRSRFGGAWDSPTMISADDRRKNKNKTTTATTATKGDEAAADIQADAYSYLYDEGTGDS